MPKGNSIFIFTCKNIKYYQNCPFCRQNLLLIANNFTNINSLNPHNFNEVSNILPIL